MIGILVFFCGLSLLFLIIDLLQKKVLTGYRWARKATHILSGGPIVIMPYFLSAVQIMILSGMFLLMLSISRRKKILALHDVDRDTIGELLYPVSIGIIAWLSLPENIRAFQIGTLILAISDGLAGLLGEAWDFGALYIGRYKKSLGGALVFFLSSLIILIAFHGTEIHTIIPLLLFALILTVVEFILVYGLDNLALPVLAVLIELFFFA